MISPVLLLLSACNLIEGFGVTPTAEEERRTPTPVTGEVEGQVEAEANRDGVFVLDAEAGRQTLSSPNQTFLGTGDGIDVDASGRAILRFADLLVVEVLRDGGLVLQQLAVEEQSAFITVLQNGGTLINDFNPEAEIERRFTIQTDFATITATGTRFMIVREEGTPLEWVVGLDAGENDLEVTAAGETKTVVSNQARWVAPVGEPSAGITAEMGSVNEWIESLRGGAIVAEIGEVVWSQADVLAAPGELTELPIPGEDFTLGGVTMRLGLDGRYTLEDCNGDGQNDIAMSDGSLTMDFRQVLSRVRALDVTVLNFASPGSGGLRVLDPGTEEIDRVTVEGSGQVEVLSLRSDEPYHYAELTLENGCFLGFSLTPPTEEGEPAPPRSAVESGPFVLIEEPLDGSSDTTNGFLLSGVSSVPFERNLTLRIETADGEPIQQQPIFVEGGEPGGEPGIFETEVTVDFGLPADIRLRVQDISPQDGSVLAEDSVLFTPLLPSGGVVERPRGNGRILAVPAGDPGTFTEIRIDGELGDWFALQETTGLDWTEISTTVFNPNCGLRYPGGNEFAMDLAGQVYIAYDDEFLYVAFQVEDDGFDGYAGPDQRYYRGDAPQLLLDMDLAGDFRDTELSPDDIQLDFLPGIFQVGDTTGVALWQLYVLESRKLEEAFIAANPTEFGYYVEAAVPWASLNYSPRPGTRLGVAASLSDNDSPETDVQECMISTAPRRDFRDPTSWGTLIFQ
jgi:hypothetical protein